MKCCILQKQGKQRSCQTYCILQYVIMFGLPQICSFRKWVSRVCICLSYLTKKYYLIYKKIRRLILISNIQLHSTTETEYHKIFPGYYWFALFWALSSLLLPPLTRTSFNTTAWAITDPTLWYVTIQSHWFLSCFIYGCLVFVTIYKVTIS